MLFYCYLGYKKKTAKKYLAGCAYSARGKVEFSGISAYVLHGWSLARSSFKIRKDY